MVVVVVVAPVVVVTGAVVVVTGAVVVVAVDVVVVAAVVVEAVEFTVAVVGDGVVVDGCVDGVGPSCAWLVQAKSKKQKSKKVIRVFQNAQQRNSKEEKKIQPKNK
jgi:hypothetical protein